MKSKRVENGVRLAVIDDDDSFSETTAEELGNASNVPIGTFELLPLLMTKAEALQAIKEINTSLNRIRVILVELEERQGYAVLGFENMSQLMQSDLFSKARSTLQKELQAGRIEHHYLNVPIGTLPEAHFRPLAKVKPEYYKPAFDKASTLAAPRSVTAKNISQAVAELLRSEPGASKKGIVEHLKERGTATAINPSPYRPGDIVLICCDRAVKEAYAQYNGCWVIVKEILAHGCTVQLMGKEWCVIWNDLKELDLIDETLESVADRVEALLEREDLDEMEREILENYHRRQWFTDWQLLMLKTIEKFRHNPEK